MNFIYKYRECDSNIKLCLSRYVQTREAAINVKPRVRLQRETCSARKASARATFSTFRNDITIHCDLTISRTLCEANSCRIKRVRNNRAKQQRVWTRETRRVPRPFRLICRVRPRSVNHTCRIDPPRRSDDDLLGITPVFSFFTNFLEIKMDSDISMGSE